VTDGANACAGARGSGTVAVSTFKAETYPTLPAAPRQKEELAEGATHPRPDGASADWVGQRRLKQLVPRKAGPPCANQTGFAPLERAKAAASATRHWIAASTPARCLESSGQIALVRGCVWVDLETQWPGQAAYNADQTRVAAGSIRAVRSPARRRSNAINYMR